MLAMWTPGPMEMMVIGIVAILIFGRKLPKMIGDMGHGIREFRKGLKEGEEDENK